MMPDATLGHAEHTAHACIADDELDKMRQQMAETASLLVSAAYEQPQVQLQHYRVKLTEHLADPTQPLDLALEAPGAPGEAQGEGPSCEPAEAPQLSRVIDSPPRTPGQDAAARAARAKRVASSREAPSILLGGVQMAAQVKQLEQRLMALREEVREKKAKARQAEGSVQDLKLQLEDLQMQKVSDRDEHDQEVEALGRKLTEAEREAAAANDKAQKLHDELHGSTFHIKLAKEAMKKVRAAEAAMHAKVAEEAEALRQDALDRRLVGEVQDKETQTDPTSKPGSPATLRRPMPTTRNAVSNVVSKAPKPSPRPAPSPRPQQPIVKREPRPVSQPKPPPAVHVATAASEKVAEALPPERGALPSARPVLPPKRQWQKSMAEIHVPTTLLKRRGAAAESSTSGGASVDTPAAILQDVPSTLAGTEMPAGNAVGHNGVVTAAAAHSRRSSVSSNTAAAPRPASPLQLAAKSAGVVRAQPGAHSMTLQSTNAKSGGSDRSSAAANSSGLSMLGHSNTQQGSRRNGQQKPQSQAAAAPDQAQRAQPPAEKQADLPGAMPAAADVLPKGGELVITRQPDREVSTIGEGGELRPMTALTDETLDTADSRLQTPAKHSRATGDVPASLPAAPVSTDAPFLEATEEDPAVADASSDGDASASRPSTADDEELWEGPVDAAHVDVDSGPVHHTPARRVHRNTVRTRPQSPLQPQISGVHGSTPSVPPGGGASAAGSVRTAQRAQHAAQPRRHSTVPSLNMAVMRALKQQVSGLVPLSGHAASSTARSVLQQTAAASQRALSQKQAPPTGTSPKHGTCSQLTPLSSNALCSRNLPNGPTHATPRAPLPQPNDHLHLAQTMLQSQLMLLTPRQALSLDATVQLIGDIYDSKGVADLAALRQQAPCKPMQQFVQQYLQTRFGTGAGGSWLGACHQLEAAARRHGDDARVAAFATSCGLLQPAEVPTSAQVLYNGSQPLPGPLTTTAWAATWLRELNSNMRFPATPARLLQLSPESRAKLMSPANLHPAVSEVLKGLAVVPGMPYVLQCTQGPAYARIWAQADLGVPLGPQQAPQLHTLLSEAAIALQLERAPQLYLQHSQQAAIHYLQLPLTTRLPGLAAVSARQRRSKPQASSVQQQQHGLDAESEAAVHQPVVVVTSRMVELLQPQELQAMFVGALSTGLAPDEGAQPPSSEGQLTCSSPSMLQVALAASLASLSGSALAEEVGHELGMLWPTRVLPALLRALPYLTLYTDRWAVQAMPEAEVVSSAILKVAAGTPLLPPGLSPDALLTESAMLQGVMDDRITTLQRQEDGHTFAATNNSLTVVRLRALQRAKQQTA
ncbi:hypothetical protein ABBQ38_006950 [Trebouxia sp. C0009 RCD-2024]